MQVKKTFVNPSLIRLTIVPNLGELSGIQDQVVVHLSDQVKVPGFRSGKAPTAMVQKQIDPSRLQTEFLDHAVSQLYYRALESEDLRPIDQPKITIKKFVPFSQLEFDAEVEVIGDIKLSDYKKMRLTKDKAKVTAKDIEEVLQSLAQRSTDRKEVSRAAINGDEVVIDFSGSDPKSGEAVKGADGKEYPLVLGSDSFIPGFEKQLIGLKPGESKTFDIKFPADYGVGALKNKLVTFKVKISKVSELAKKVIDDSFVSKVSPFKTVVELKEDIKKQLLVEHQAKIDRAFEGELVAKITAGSTLAVPAKLVDEQVERAEQEERQNLAYAGQTWQEHLAQEGITEEEHRTRNRSGAEENVKASLVLGEISRLEKITVSEEEVDQRIIALKQRYPDQAMQESLSKPENRTTISNQILTERTFQKLVGYVTANNSKN